MRRRFLTIGIVAAAFVLTPAALSFNPQPDPPGFRQLIVDIRALPPSQHPLPLVLEVLAAREAAVHGHPCVAKVVIDVFRRQVAARTGRTGFPDQTRGVLDADALGVLVGLLQADGSERCGGTGVPAAPGSAPDVNVVSSDTSGLTLHVSFPAPSFTTRIGNGVAYEDVAMDGLGSPGAVGKPNVPALTRFFALPQGADGSVRVLGSTGYDLNGIRLWPQQEEAPDADRSPFASPPFTIDTKAYSTNAPYPATPVREAALGTMRDLSLGGVETDGAQYNPASQSLHVYTGIDLRVDFVGQNSGVFGDDRTTSVWNLSFQNVYRSSLLNYATVVGNLSVGRWIFCGEEYLIVTSHALEPAADTLAAARNADGIKTRVVTVGSGAGDIGTTPTEIKLFIAGQLSGSCLIRPSYVGILGDTAQVPTWKVTSPEASLTGFDGMIATDLPYALTGGSDLVPDLAIGRMPAPDLTTATNEVAKIVGYEDSPPFAPAFYSHATVTSYFQCGIDAGGTPCNPGTQDERTFTKLSETVRNGLLGEGYTVDRVYTTTAVNPQKFYDGTSLPAGLLKPGFPWNGTGTDVLNDWNAGRFLILHRDHGAPSGWSNPNVSTANIPSLTNGSLLPVVFSINCASGKFDDATPNFAEQLVEKASGGAVGVIGDSRNSPSNTNSHLAAGLIDAIFPGTLPAYGSSTPIYRMGDVLVAGKQYMNTQNGLDGQANADTQAEEYLYHWFGDPTMPIWKHQPLFIMHSAVLASIVENAVHVSVSDPALEGTVVTLYANGEAIGRALITNGEATIVPQGPVPPPEPDERTSIVVALDQDGYVPTDIPVEQAVIVGDGS